MTRKEVEELQCKAKYAEFLQNNIDALNRILDWYSGNESRIEISYGGETADIHNKAKDKMIFAIKESIRLYQNELNDFK